VTIKGHFNSCSEKLLRNIYQLYYVPGEPGIFGSNRLLVNPIMPYGYGGYGGGLKPANVLRSLNGSLAALADGATCGNITFQIPIDATSGKAIQIEKIVIEFSDATWIITDNKDIAFMLSRQQKTAEVFLNDSDIMHKLKMHSEILTSGAGFQNQVIEMDFAKPLPFFGSQLFLSIRNNTGATQSIYAKLWYKDLYMDPRQMLASLQSQVI